MELDTARGCLRRKGEEVHVRAKTFQILVYLVANRDRLVPKEELLEQFWKDTAVSEDVLAHSIAEVRRVLGDSSREPLYLKTIPKRGYRFVGDVQEVPIEAVVATEQITTIQVREVYSDEPPRRRYWRWAVVTALIVASTGLLVIAWKNVGSSVRELEYWEIAWWKLDEGRGSKITDSIHGLTATLPAGVSWSEGISGAGLQFSGRPLIVRGNDPGVLPGGDGPRTLSAWIKTNTTNADSPVIFVYGYNTPRNFTYDQVYMLILDKSGVGTVTGMKDPLFGKTRVDDGRWHQLTAVFEAGDTRRLRLFIDGIEDASAVHAWAPLIPGRQSEWAIARSLQSGTSFRGVLDDIRVYERALRPDEIRSLYRCMAGPDDIRIEGRGSYYFAPVFGNNVEILAPRSGENSAGVRNAGKDFAGVMFVRRQPDCSLRSIHGADVGQDFNIEVQLLVPAGPGGIASDGGPYFRSRRANPGDGIIGGTSAGFLVHLDSTGQVRVRRLHPNTVLGFSKPPEGFDAGVFHRLEVAVQGETLEVALDGRALTFDVAGAQRDVLQISPAWETASPTGKNGGSAGVAFGIGAPRNRGQAGGQEARNIRFKPYHALRASQDGKALVMK